MSEKSPRTRQHEIPLAPLRRIFRSQGAERISDDAVVFLREYLEKLAREIALEAIEASRHANRRTVTDEDVKFAISRLQRAHSSQTL
ncbi:histone family protein [Thermofilum pendens]|uniref:Archaeal histone n=1 Tax=Thermofilum pendens (strain DSM 2475 / Hrk 5) TaxID=368408 RepID=A1RX27_THEPD|nr:histone [Thermofilum pendens]ABL77757.1 archaeal histone [Thermofilum pendens Hrk 5]